MRNEIFDLCPHVKKLKAHCSKEVDLEQVDFFLALVGMPF